MGGCRGVRLHACISLQQNPPRLRNYCHGLPPTHGHTHLERVHQGLRALSADAVACVAKGDNHGIAPGSSMLHACMHVDIHGLWHAQASLQLTANELRSQCMMHNAPGLVLHATTHPPTHLVARGPRGPCWSRALRTEHSTAQPRRRARRGPTASWLMAKPKQGPSPSHAPCRTSLQLSAQLATMCM